MLLVGRFVQVNLSVLTVRVRVLVGRFCAAAPVSTRRQVCRIVVPEVFVLTMIPNRPIMRGKLVRMARTVWAVSVCARRVGLFVMGSASTQKRTRQSAGLKFVLAVLIAVQMILAGKFVRKGKAVWIAFVSVLRAGLFVMTSASIRRRTGTTAVPGDAMATRLIHPIGRVKPVGLIRVA